MKQKTDDCRIFIKFKYYSQKIETMKEKLSYLKVVLLALVVVLASCEKKDEIAELQCDVTSTNVTSFGADDGTITVTVKKGNGGYEFYLNDEYHVDGNFTELEAGTYNVKVTDNEDQMFTKSVTITEPNPNTLDVEVSS
ncbi:MAG: SprB repeat-containing protein, partial [Tenuifilaceae bacterium]|nr:SprB repeat-containing protein [Tenuifilaceae bacterium]